jgi:hypothetical protein
MFSKIINWFKNSWFDNRENDEDYFREDIELEAF